MDDFEAAFDEYCLCRGYEIKTDSSSDGPPSKSYGKDGNGATMKLNKAKNTLDVTTRNSRFSYRWLGGSWRMNGGNKNLSTERVLANLDL